jgi:hypothetical protein
MTQQTEVVSAVGRGQRRSHRGRRLAQQAMAGVGNNDLARRLRRKAQDTRPDRSVATVARADDDGERSRKRLQARPHRGYRARTQTA